jgi:hypothetical protein
MSPRTNEQGTEWHIAGFPRRNCELYGPAQMTVVCFVHASSIPRYAGATLWLMRKTLSGS